MLQVSNNKNYNLTSNLLNNQNYIIGGEIKTRGILDFYMNDAKFVFPLNVVAYIILYWGKNKTSLYSYKSNKNIILFTNYFLLLLFSALLQFVFIYFYTFIGYFSFFLYLSINLYFCLKLIDITNDFFETKMIIFGFRKRKESPYNNYSYNDKLIDKIVVNDNVLNNNKLTIEKVIITITYLFIIINMLFVTLAIL